MKEFLTIEGEGKATVEIKHSVFIADVKGISSFEEGMRFVKERASAYSDATHNCYALVCSDGSQKFSDNGEPQGTAGTPILEVIKKQGLTDVVCVVTRYFGGIKLGAGGLVTAYAQSASEAIADATVIKKKESVVRSCTLGYHEYTALLRLADTFGAVCCPPVYEEQVTIEFYYPEERDGEWLEKEKELFLGNVKTKVRERIFKKYTSK